MAYTQLSPTGVSGRRYSFSPKSSGGKGAGLFTALSTIAVPGMRHSFVAKTPAIPGKGAGLFTSLSVLALPGARHSFTPKQEVEYQPEVVQTYYGSGAGERRSYYYDEIKARQRERILKDDEEILDVLIQVIISDIL